MSGQILRTRLPYNSARDCCRDCPDCEHQIPGVDQDLITRIRALPKGEELYTNRGYRKLLLTTDDLHSLVEHIEKLEADRLARLAAVEEKR